MKTVTLKDLENKEILSSLLNFVKLEQSKGAEKSHIFKTGLIKHRGLTRATALKVIELANLSL